MPGKLDLYAQHKDEYVTPSEPLLITVKPARYLSITGKGEPGGDAFQVSTAALYNVAFTVKMSRKAAGRDYAVSKLEGLWWGKSKNGAVWNWQLLIRVPEWIHGREVSEAAEGLVKKGKPKEVLNVELVVLNEGRSVQMLHVGPYDREAETIRQMAAFATARRLAFRGKHHEIYLSDPRRVAASKLRTILRYPVE